MMQVECASVKSCQPLSTAAAILVFMDTHKKENHPASNTGLFIKSKHDYLSAKLLAYNPMNLSKLNQHEFLRVPSIIVFGEQKNKQLQEDSQSGMNLEKAIIIIIANTTTITMFRILVA